MNIYIVTGESFPKGMAATNRIISYGKGLIANKARVKVICLRAYQYPADYKGEIISKGFFENIPYVYSPGTCQRGKTFLKRRYLEFYGLLNGLKILLHENKKQRIDAIIMHSNAISYIIFFKLITTIFRIKYLQEKSELPFVLKKKSILGKIYASFYINTVYRLFDGILVESEILNNYFKPKLKKNGKLLIVPATIDSEQILNESELKSKDEYIFYCGSISKSKKDGVDILIYSFKKVLNEFPKIKLFISGFGSQEYIKFLNDIVNELNISENVQFLGKISRDKLVTYLKNAKILALAKETDKVQSGGLSSKVIEYLYTGNPVVLTDLKDITSHLHDKETVFFAKPDNIDSFADTLIYVLRNYETAKEVGIAGQKFALEYFDYKKHTKRIIKFIQNL